MGNNFKKMTVLHKGRYYEIDKKPEFHQAACKHKFIKGQIVKTMGETGTTTATKDTLKIPPIGRLPKKVNLCKKCGKVKARNN